jgi:hypothetical protein
MTDEDLKQRLDTALADIQQLQQRVLSLEQTQGPGQKRVDTSLVADSFLKRAFAVWGHNFVAGIIIAIPIWFFVFIIMLAVGIGLDY